jgi:DNA replication initiation complex subunit (GINS family)|tara:strand:+ start:1513 stop:1656 length:144 start_codon:yes stop_codon:yes gene_type:complete
MTKLQELTKKAFQETVEDIVSQAIYDLKDDFWLEISEPLQKELYHVI